MKRIFSILFELGWKLRLILTTPIGSPSKSYQWQQNHFISTSSKFIYGENNLQSVNNFNEVVESHHYPSHNIDNTWNDINTNPSYSHIPSNIYYDTFNNHSQH